MFGDNRTSKMFNDFRKDTRSSTHAINNLRNQIIAAFSVRELVTAGDTFVNLQNRMGALTGNANDTAEAMAHMKRIAIESRSDFSAVGDLFAKITFATKEMGLSQQEVADATQTVANTFIISGASAIEAANASRQLAQGLASGTLRGDELNSVMEQNSALAELLAKGLGVSTGQLREMGAAGKITAENILPTLISATDETNKTIAEMNMTIGQSISLLKTQFTTLIGEFEEATGVFGGTATAIGMLAKNMELLLIPATALAVSAIPKLVKGVVALGVAVRANPVTALATGLAALVATAKILNPELSSLQDKLQSALGKQETALNNLIKAQKKFGENSPEFRIFLKEYDEISNEVQRLRDLVIEQNKAISETPDALKSFTDQYDKIIEKSKESIQVVKTFAETIEGKLTNAFTDFFDFTSKGFGDFKQLATSIIRAIIAELIQMYIVQQAVGIVKGALSAPDLSGGFTGTPDISDFEPITFAGGGYTGMGARAGGLDGKGGFLAMMHPRETVIDHTKGQGMGATVNFNITTVDAAGFDELLASRKNMIISMVNQAYNSRGKMGIA
jgi:tape measure domain-containing protein